MTAGSISAPYIIPLRVGHSQKFLIDTNTLIEIRSNTNDVDIYYTLDGSKPDALITLTTRHSTIQYKKPFYIPREIANSGKVAIKAIAVSRNGIRESVVVTKTFDIKVVPSDHVQSDEYENRYLYELQQERKELMRKIQNEHEQTQQKLSESMHHSATDSSGYIYPDSQIQTNRFQKQTDVLRCAHCFAPKTNDLYTRFCTECGLPWQKLTQQSPEISSIKTCLNCQSTIPFNSNVCVVCETPVGSEKQQFHRTNIQNQSTILCPQCKSANPTHLRTCYICECILMPTPIPQIRASVSVPIAPKVTGIMMTCSKCFRLNNSDARFCDWCGAQPERVLIPIQCTKCQANNDPNAKFCSTCGCVIDPRIRNDLTIPASSIIASTLINHSTNPTWLNANATLTHNRQPHLITKTEAATQTYGIYYPNAKDLDLLITQNKQLLADKDFKEQRPVLKSVSPGKGYWRKQLDHVCGHLKAYAVNRPDFRSLIGEPRMGKMVHGTIHETESQVTVQAVFRKPENLSQSSFYVDERNEHYPMNSERSSTFSSTFNSDDEYIREKPQRKKSKKRLKKRLQSATVTTTTDTPNNALLKLLATKRISDKKKSSYHIDISEEVERLLREKKADANSHNKDGYTALQLAVLNQHNECLEILIKHGKANVNKRGARGNTALHECCLLGFDGVEPLDILLKHGGDKTLLNDRKKSVVDLASDSGCKELLQVISKYQGQQMIHQYEKNSYEDRPRIKPINDQQMDHQYEKNSYDDRARIKTVNDQHTVHQYEKNSYEDRPRIKPINDQQIIHQYEKNSYDDRARIKPINDQQMIHQYEKNSYEDRLRIKPINDQHTVHQYEKNSYKDQARTRTVNVHPSSDKH